MTDLYRLPARYRTWFKFAFAHGGTKLTGQSPSHIRGAVTSMQTKFVSSLITLCHIPLCCKTNFSVGTEHPMSLDPLSTTSLIQRLSNADRNRTFTTCFCFLLLRFFATFHSLLYCQVSSADFGPVTIVFLNWTEPNCIVSDHRDDFLSYPLCDKILQK